MCAPSAEYIKIALIGAYVPPNCFSGGNRAPFSSD